MSCEEMFNIHIAVKGNRRTARKWPKKNVIKYSGNSRELETKKEEKIKNVREK